MVATVVAVAVDVLHGGVDIDFMFFVGRKIVELHATAVDAVLGLLGDVGLVGRTVEQVTATAELLQMVVLEGQLGVGTGLEEGTEAYGLVAQLGQLGEAVAVVVEAAALAVLPEDIDARLVVVGHQRGVHRRIVVERREASYTHNRMSQLGGVAQGFLGDDVDGTRNSRRTEEGRTASTHHFHTFDHVGRYLLQPVHTCQSTEYGARVYKNLGIGTVEAVDAHLLETAVLTVVFHTYAGLKVQSLSQCGRVGLFEELEVHDVDQRGGQASGRLTAVGGDHHAVQRHEVFLQFEILFQRDALLQNDFACQCLVTYGTDLQRKAAFGQILQKIVSGGIGQGTDGGSFQGNGNIREVFFGMFFQYMSYDVGIRTLQFFGYKSGGQQCAQQSHHKKDIFFHVSSILII